MLSLKSNIIHQIFFASYNKDALEELRNHLLKQKGGVLKKHLIYLVEEIGNRSDDNSYYYFKMTTISSKKDITNIYSIIDYNKINVYYLSYHPGSIFKTNDINNYFFDTKYIIEIVTKDGEEVIPCTNLVSAIYTINKKFNDNLKPFTTLSELGLHLIDIQLQTPNLMHLDIKEIELVNRLCIKRKYWHGKYIQ